MTRAFGAGIVAACWLSVGCGLWASEPAAPVAVDASAPVDVQVEPRAEPASAPPAHTDTPETVTLRVNDGPPIQARVLAGDELPPGVHTPPFSSADLRAGMPLGTTLRYRITRTGHPVVLSTWEVIEHRSDAFRLRTTDAREDGSLYAPPREQTLTWGRLRDRSAFPEAEYTRTDSTVRFGGKAEKAVLYETRGDAAGVIERTWFALAVPGPPILFVHAEGGVETMRMELLERSP